MYGLHDLSFKKDFNNSIFEIKYDKNYDSYVKKNLKNISLRISKSSKYVITALNKPISFSWMQKINLIFISIISIIIFLSKV